MSTTVLAPSGLEISSNHEDGQAMLASLTKTTDKTPRVLRDKGVEVKPEGDDKDAHAVALGKKGGEAAAKARKAEAKAKPADEKPEAKEAKPADDKAKPETKADPETEPEVKEAAEPGKDKKGNPRHDPEARIGVLAREKREAQERADRLERELAEARRSPAPAAREDRTEREPARRTAATQETDEPRLATFLSKHAGDEATALQEYMRAHGKWNRDEWNRESAAKQEAERRQGFVRGKVGTFLERITGLKADDPTVNKSYKEYVSTLPDELTSQLITTKQMEDFYPGEPIVGANIVADMVVLKTQNPRDVLEHFAENMHEFQRIAALQDPLEIAAEVAILSKRLDAATADTSSEREVSRAGTPPRSVGGSPKTADPDLSNVPFEEHMRRKKAKA